MSLQSAQDLKKMSTKEQKALVVDSAPKLVEQYAKFDAEIKASMKKRGCLKLWFKLSGKRKLESKKHYVKISRHDVRELDVDKLKKMVNPIILKKCTVKTPTVSIRLYEKKQNAE